MTTSPSGLASSYAILSSSLEPARPTDPHSPVAARLSPRSRSATSRPAPVSPPRAAPHHAAPAEHPAQETQITGLAALALHGFASTPPLPALDRIDVLVPRTRRLRSVGFARIVRGQALPEPEEITGLPVAPVTRALADTVRDTDDAVAVRRILTEAVRARHCEARAVVRELSRARLLSRPHVADAIDALLAEGRAIAEEHLYDMVCFQDLPDPCWNVELRLPGGPHLGGLDAYWPDHAVAVDLDTRAPRHGQEEESLWEEYARKRESLERFGITVVYLTPAKLRDSPEQQAAIVRTALMAAADREPPAPVVVTPR
ncbi:hypothetical protein [Streptomyces armeniacus]|uniref:hypothetical protein n=1 Tax=Streptomyces armeniacus TaxID=83291 RepID=UPI00269918C9